MRASVSRASAAADGLLEELLHPPADDDGLLDELELQPPEELLPRLLELLDRPPEDDEPLEYRGEDTAIKASIIYVMSCFIAYLVVWC